MYPKSACLGAGWSSCPGSLPTWLNLPPSVCLSVMLSQVQMLFFWCSSGNRNNLPLPVPFCTDPLVQLKLRFGAGEQTGTLALKTCLSMPPFTAPGQCLRKGYHCSASDTGLYVRTWGVSLLFTKDSLLLASTHV